MYRREAFAQGFLSRSALQRKITAGRLDLFLGAGRVRQGVSEHLPQTGQTGCTPAAFCIKTQGQFIVPVCQELDTPQCSSVARQ